MNNTRIAAILSLFFISLQGCATVFTGYYTDVKIDKYFPGLRITTSDSVDMPVFKTQKEALIPSDDDSNDRWRTPFKKTIVTNYFIKLRSNKSYILNLHTKDRSKKMEIFPKFNGWWFFLDIIPGGILGGIPMFVDYYTGNWNTFDEIDGEIK
jgi:hypothetical protein